MTEKEFWYNVSAPNEDGCMIWMRGKHPYGYGALQYEGKVWSSHRLAWVLTYGPISKGLAICHKCDNPPCCNPRHLFMGTKKDNSQDMARKGRSSFGERNGMSRLVEADVCDIHALRLAGWQLHRIAAKYGIGTTAVHNITVGRRWMAVYDSLNYDPAEEYKKVRASNLKRGARRRYERSES
jgi:hypothetical protein